MTDCGNCGLPIRPPRTEEEVFSDYMITRQLVEATGGIAKADPDLVRCMVALRKEAVTLAIVELDAKARRN